MQLNPTQRNFIAAIAAICLPSSTTAGIISINWQDIGGPDVFERQALTFSPISVDRFDRLETEGEHLNKINTSNANADALIYLRLADNWQIFARDTGVNGPYQSSFPLDGFVFEDLDFSSGSISGINFTNQAAGATNYRYMNSGFGTTFYFSTEDPSDIPVPASLLLLAIGFLALFGNHSLVLCNDEN
jgi:hypothetical protein